MMAESKVDRIFAASESATLLVASAFALEEFANEAVQFAADQADVTDGNWYDFVKEPEWYSIETLYELCEKIWMDYNVCYEASTDGEVLDQLRLATDHPACVDPQKKLYAWSYFEAALAYGYEFVVAMDPGERMSLDEEKGLLAPIDPHHFPLTIDCCIELIETGWIVELRDGAGPSEVIDSGFLLHAATAIAKESQRATKQLPPFVPYVANSPFLRQSESKTRSPRTGTLAERIVALLKNGDKPEQIVRRLSVTANYVGIVQKRYSDLIR